MLKGWNNFAEDEICQVCWCEIFSRLGCRNIPEKGQEQYISFIKNTGNELSFHQSILMILPLMTFFILDMNQFFKLLLRNKECACFLKRGKRITQRF